MDIIWDQITSPTLLLREPILKANMDRMLTKAKHAGVQLRPHFKTHQSAEIGEWFRQSGVNRIAVSSVEMAYYFFKAGWEDILIAFPANVREHRRLTEMAKQIKLSVIVDSSEALAGLQEKVSKSLSIWIEIDVGDGRSGRSWAAADEIEEMARTIAEDPIHHWAGLMSHAGHSYAARGKNEILAIHEESLERIRTVRDRLEKVGLTVEGVSVGDTPTCSMADNFPGATEIRPGNFAFYDLMQQNIGSCGEADIAVGLACPVVARYPERGELILHGGAVHLGKDFIVLANSERIFGHLAYPNGDGWSAVEPDCVVTALSQEHGVARVSQQMVDKVRVGDLLIVLPIHSCLTADLMGEYSSAESMARGVPIRTMRTRIGSYLNEIVAK